MSPRVPNLQYVFAAAALAALGACGSSASPPMIDAAAPATFKAPDVATTKNGDVKATDANGMRNYFAIPFAAPPVGALRWAAPAPAANWTTPLANAKPPAPCLQTSASTFKLPGAQEDCLYLDVHAPTTTVNTRFPVMVWFHGGAFNTGGAITYQNPSPMVGHDVIVVATNYRMGPLGFLGHPALAAPDGTVGNYGIMDQQAALKWVQDNIEAFGGDKNNVTIFGESAGGYSVLTHLASPLSKNLFHKAIIESGGYAFDRQVKLEDLKAASTTIVTTAMTAAGATCATATVDAACLRGLSADMVGTQLATAFTTTYASPVPSYGDTVLPLSIKATFAAGTNTKVPVLNGTNALEYSLFIAGTEYVKRLAANNFDPTNTTFALQPDNAATTPYSTTIGGFARAANVPTAQIPTVVAAYPVSAYGDDLALQPSLGASAAGTDEVFACQGLNFSKKVLAQGSPVFHYEFRDFTALPSLGNDPATGKYGISFNQGPGHSYELQYIFGLRDLQTDEHKALSTAMAAYWTNFARSGNPNTGATTPAVWPAFTGPDKVLGLDIASKTGVKALATFDADHKCSSVWTTLTF